MSKIQFVFFVLLLTICFSASTQQIEKNVMSYEKIHAKSIADLEQIWNEAGMLEKKAGKYAERHKN